MIEVGPNLTTILLALVAILSNLVQVYLHNQQVNTFLTTIRPTNQTQTPGPETQRAAS